MWHSTLLMDMVRGDWAVEHGVLARWDMVRMVHGDSHPRGRPQVE